MPRRSPPRTCSTLVASLVALLVVGCASTSTRRDPGSSSTTDTPDDVAAREDADDDDDAFARGPPPRKVKGSRSIAMMALAFELIPGQRLGTYGVGQGRRVLSWEPGVAFGFDVYQRHANRALADAGYDVTGPREPIFETDESGKAELQLGAVFRALDVAARADQWTGALKEMTVTATIEWRLYDPITEEVVFRVVHEDVEGEGLAPAEAIFHTYAASLGALLADEKFVRAAAKPADDVAASSLPELTLPSCPKVTRASLDESLQAVVILRVGASHGSGVVVTPDGHVLTAAHVVAGASRIEIEDRNGKKYAGTVVRLDRKVDLALVKLDGFPTSCLALRRVSPKTGDAVFAMGAPGRRELAFSVSRGILSGQRTIDDVEWLQTDAAISPGNSGGPLVDEQGQVVGIVTTKLVGRGIEGLGFAVPVWTVEKSLALDWK